MCAESVLGTLGGHTPSLGTEEQSQGGRGHRADDGSSCGDFKGKDREGARPGQGTRSGSQIQFIENCIHCTGPWAVLLGASESKGASGNKRKMLPRPVLTQMSLVKSTNCNSLFQWLCMKASLAQVKVHDVFTENADLLFSQE